MKGNSCLLLGFLILCIGSVPSNASEEENALETLFRSRRGVSGNNCTCNGNGSNNTLLDVCAKVTIGIDIGDCVSACKDGKVCQANLLEILVKLLLKLSSCTDDERDLLDVCILIQLQDILKDQKGDDALVLLKLVVKLAVKLIVKLKAGLNLL